MADSSAVAAPSDAPSAPCNLGGSAERLFRCLHFQPVDHIPDFEFGYWDEVFAEWPQQGLPAIEASHRAFELYFGFEQMNYLPIHCGLIPGFSGEIVKVEGDYEYFRDGDGVLCRRPADHHSTMPEHLEYQLVDRESWEKIFKPMLRPDDPLRVAPNLVAAADAALAAGEAPVLHVGSLCGLPRNWMGFEQFCVMMYTDPELITEIAETLMNVALATLERALPLVAGKVRHAHFWEDISFNAGPIVPPDVMRAVYTPRYRQITDLLRRHGIDRVSLDSDGDIRLLIEPWLEGGVNTLFPLEQNGGNDAVELRRQYGHDVLLMGGIDKTKMARGGDVIRRELERLAPVVAEGGYVPFCDHRCPPDVSLAAYREYVQAKRELFGIPAKAERLRTDTTDLK